jgi:DNA-binding response OmpR family regulator
MASSRTETDFTHVSTILLADDDQLLRLIMRERLERAGHEVLECGDGFAALEIAMEERPDCLVLDVMMPLARGLEVVRQVRREDGWTPGIVMVSARTKATDRLNALDAGADVYLEKPIKPDALVEAVAHVTVDRVPTRIVDVLGPVWATLAMDRLLRAATDGSVAERAAALTERFADQMRTVLGRRGPSLPSGPVALRVYWEHALRELIGDATDPDIPAFTDVRVPDLGMFLRRLAPAELTLPTGAQSHEWAVVLARVLAAAATASDIAAVQSQFSASLAHVLGIGAVDDDQWTTTLGHVLGHRPPAGDVAAEALLTSTFGTALGDVLGIHSHENDRWARTLAHVLAYRTPLESATGLHMQAHMSDVLDVAMGRRRLAAPAPAHSPTGDLWQATVAEVLRGQDGVVQVPDVRELLARDRDQSKVGR